jgi:hypothetical protein
MRIASVIATTAATAALLVMPGLAAGDPPAGSPSSDHSAAGSHPAVKHHAPSASDKAKAFGKLCQGESKKHVAGQKGTPFSQCVTAMAKLASGRTASPAKACKALSRKHVAGRKGTPFSQCVKAAAKLKG